QVVQNLQCHNKKENNMQELERQAPLLDAVNLENTIPVKRDIE
ncbi:hypothetical protein AAUPMB_02486, partial [Pasteurella multocida subsp. multocida str. Anand1_buffalo]